MDSETLRGLMAAPVGHWGESEGEGEGRGRGRGRREGEGEGEGEGAGGGQGGGVNHSSSLFGTERLLRGEEGEEG